MAQSPKETKTTTKVETKKIVASKKRLNIMYLVVFGVLLLGSAAILAFSNSDSSSTSLVEFTAEEEPKFSILYPEGWDVNQAAGRASFTEPVVEGDDFQADMQVAISDFTQIEQEVTKDEIFNEFRQNAAAQFESQDPADDDYAFNIRDEEVTINGYNTLLYSIDINNIDGVEGESGSGEVAIVYINETTVATIFVEAHQSDVKFVEAFTDILESFDYPSANS